MDNIQPPHHKSLNFMTFTTITPQYEHNNSFSLSHTSNFQCPAPRFSHSQELFVFFVKSYTVTFVCALRQPQTYALAEFLFFGSVQTKKRLHEVFLVQTWVTVFKGLKRPHFRPSSCLLFPLKFSFSVVILGPL